MFDRPWLFGEPACVIESLDGECGLDLNSFGAWLVAVVAVVVISATLAVYRRWRRRRR